MTEIPPTQSREAVLEVKTGLEVADEVTDHALGDYDSYVEKWQPVLRKKWVSLESIQTRDKFFNAKVKESVERISFVEQYISKQGLNQNGALLREVIEVLRGLEK